MDLKFARKFNAESTADRRQVRQSTASCGAIVAVRCSASNLRLRGDETLYAEVHCAAVFCAAGCELYVRRSAPLKTYRKRAKFNRSSTKF